MMICPNCGSFYEEGDHYCSACGIALGEPKGPAPRRKHTVWPPVLIMLAMVIVGFVVYFATASWQKPLSTDTEYPWFQVDGGVLYFAEEAYTGDPELVIPEAVDGQAVTALGEDCFADCDTLVSVILPDSLEEIRDGAFRDCDALRGIFTPGGVLYLGEAAFAECPELESICFEAIPAAIGTAAFESCPSQG